jgi:hypothetical protein
MTGISKFALIAAIGLALSINPATAKGGGSNGGNHNATTTSSQATKTSNSGQTGQQQKTNLRKSSGNAASGAQFLHYQFQQPKK